MMDRSKAAQHNVLESRGVSQKGDGKGCNSRHALTKLRAVPVQRQRECHGTGGRWGNSWLHLGCNRVGTVGTGGSARSRVGR